MSFTNQSNNKTQNLFFLIGFVFVLYILKSLIVPLLFAVILSISIFPLVSFLEQKFKFPKILSALTAIFLSMVVIALVCFFIGYQLSEIIAKSDIYAQKLNIIYSDLSVKCEKNYHIKFTKFVFNEKTFATIFKNNLSKIFDFVSASGSLVGDLFLVALYMFFFLLYRKFLRSFLYKIFAKNGNVLKVRIILNRLYDVQINYLLGLITVIIIVGLLNSFGLLILGIENAFFYGFLASLLLLIPYVGILIGSLIPAFIALVTKDSYWYCIGVLALFAVIQMIEGNIITPKIVGSKISMNSFIAVLAIIIFSMLWGAAGMILALPVTASMKVVFDAIPALQPYGFLISEPAEHHITSTAHVRLKKWKSIRKIKKK